MEPVGFWARIISILGSTRFWGAWGTWRHHPQKTCTARVLHSYRGWAMEATVADLFCDSRNGFPFYVATVQAWELTRQFFNQKKEYFSFTLSLVPTMAFLLYIFHYLFVQTSKKALIPTLPIKYQSKFPVQYHYMAAVKGWGANPPYF